MENQIMNDNTAVIPEDKPEIKNQGNSTQREIISKISDRQNANILMQGVIWAEVLGRPLYKRKYRGRYGL